MGEWIDDVRSTPAAPALFDELQRDLVPGHVLHGIRDLRVVARARPQDEIVVEIDDERVTVKHLTWTREPERLPCPTTDVFTSADAPAPRPGDAHV